MATIKSQVLKEFPDAKCIKIKGDLYHVISPPLSGISKYTEEEAWLYFKNSYCKPIPPINKSNHEEDIEDGIDEYLKYLRKVDKYNEEHLRSSVERYFKAGVNWYKEQLNKK